MTLRNFAIYLTGAMLASMVFPAHATCSSNLATTTPTSHFVVHDDGTVTHTPTGLMWMRCALGKTWTGTQCDGNSRYAWDTALEESKNHSFAGYTDWRLPNKNELESIVDRGCHVPALNAIAFPNSGGTYWSSTPYTGDDSSVWAVDFAGGEVKTVPKFQFFFGLSARLVRTAQ